MKHLIFVLALFVFPMTLLAADAKSPQKREFFALCMDTHDEKQRSIDEQNAMLAGLGFDGVAHLWLDKLEQRVTSARKVKLHVTQVYFRVDLSQNPSFDPKLKETLPCLKGENTQLALLIYGGKPSDESLDEKAVGVIREIVNIAEPNGVKLVLYPHVDAWNETVTDCVRVAEKFPDKKVGVMFNLCHWVAVDKSENLEKTLKLAMPYLACVTINGTDTPEEVQSRPGRPGWLGPLDSGTFDQKQLLSLLDELGYCGPVGLQCYGISGDAKIHLERSLKKWHALRNEK
ncbi:MAG: sugar phosphate isomerase/epimerase [Planctomycetaceae bacterium]|nr:sugar phosphate isomerase/epimerase [Planctomycetaceae bacterium]